MKSPFQVGFKLSIEMFPKSNEEKNYIARVSYARDVVSLMYAILCRRPYISHLIIVVIRFMYDLGNEYWMVVKIILMYLQGNKNCSFHYYDHGIDIFYLHGFVYAYLFHKDDLPLKNM